MAGCFAAVGGGFSGFRPGAIGAEPVVGPTGDVQSDLLLCHAQINGVGVWVLHDPRMQRRKARSGANAGFCPLPYKSEPRLQSARNPFPSLRQDQAASPASVAKYGPAACATHRLPTGLDRERVRRSAGPPISTCRRCRARPSRTLSVKLTSRARLSSGKPARRCQAVYPSHIPCCPFHTPSFLRRTGRVWW